jgi:hypothetical protein
LATVDAVETTLIVSSVPAGGSIATVAITYRLGCRNEGHRACVSHGQIETAADSSGAIAERRRKIDLGDSGIGLGSRSRTPPIERWEFVFRQSKLAEI